MNVETKPYYTMRDAANPTEVAAPEMLSGIRDAVLIYNPTAGRRRGPRRQRLEIAREILRQAGVDATLQPTTGPGAATQLARQAVAERRELVIACGGDGTINEVVNGLAGSQVPLAVLPAGTANVLAKELDLPWTIPEAARVIPRCFLRRIALGAAFRPDAPHEVRYFLSLAGAGADGAVVNAVKWETKLRLGQLAYWLEGFRQLVVYRFPKFRVVADGREERGSAVVIGRTKHYGGPFRITTGASLWEDCFELAVTETRSRLRYLTYLPALMRGTLHRARGLHFWKATEVRCEPLGDDPVYAQMDGEPLGTLPLVFRIVPDALTLLVPEHADGKSAAGG